MRTCRYLYILLIAQVVFTSKDDGAAEVTVSSAPTLKSETNGPHGPSLVCGKRKAKSIKYKRKDGSEVTHYIIHFHHITWIKASLFCRNKGMTLGLFKEANEPTEVIEKYRQKHCKNCKMLVWVKNAGNLHRSRNKCVFLMLNNAVSGRTACTNNLDGFICTGKEIKKNLHHLIKKVLTPPLVKMVHTRPPVKRKRNQQKVITYARKDGTTAKFCVLKSTQTLTWNTARNACCKIGYRLGIFEDIREAKHVMNTVRRRRCQDCDGLMWMGGVRKRKENSCPAVTLLKPKSLRINCNHKVGEESRRPIIGFVCSKIQKPKHQLHTSVSNRISEDHGNK
ncbi:hypothetical protein ANCCAN_05781 [Ancylostoma caninum]|uniref:C-type lectin domain-containing protein n=1 Tax=Ancylostoma caninum TaxID=29170 RepID=A0A368GUN9_ANCCA|nr:hypothetical protein ANCCAN_05781 [Ancylostoma caninum]